MINIKNEKDEKKIYDISLHEIDEQNIINLINNLMNSLLKEPLYKDERESAKVVTSESSIGSVQRNYDIIFQSIPLGHLLKKINDRIYEEINLVYSSYIGVEKELYTNITYQIRCKEGYPFYNILQFITKLKEISVILDNTWKLCTFINENMEKLKNILSEIDSKLSPLYHIGYLSIKMIKRKLESQNSDLNYILQSKIIDEISSIADNLSKIIEKSINSTDVTNFKSSLVSSKRDSTLSSDHSLSNDDMNLMKSLHDSLTDTDKEKEYYRKLISKKNTVLKSINQNLDKIEKSSKFRVNYKNLSILILYGTKTVKEENSKNIGLILEDNDTQQDINCIFDEEIIIKKFVSKNAVKEYLNHWKSRLNKSNKRNLRLILVHNGIFKFLYGLTFFSYTPCDSKEERFKVTIFGVIFLHIGILISKIFFNVLLGRNSHKYKISIIISLLFMLFSFTLTTLHNFNFSWLRITTLFYINRVFFGLSSGQNIHSKYIVSFSCRSLLKSYINQFNMTTLITLSAGFLTSGVLDFIFSRGIIPNDNLDLATDILLLGIIIIFIIIFLISFKNIEERNYTSIFIESVGTIKGKEDESVGKKKILGREEGRKIDEANEFLEEKNKNFQSDTNNELRKYVISLVKKEKSTCSNLSKGTYALIISLLTTSFVFPYVLLIHPFLIYSIKEEDISLVLFVLGLSYYILFIIQLFSCNIKKLIKTRRTTIFIELVFLNILIGLLNFITEFGNENQLVFYILVIFFSLLLNGTLKVSTMKMMSKLVPQSYKICNLNICLFIELVDKFIICTFLGVSKLCSIKLQEFKRISIIFFSFLFLITLLYGCLMRYVKVSSQSRIIKKHIYVD